MRTFFVITSFCLSLLSGTVLYSQNARQHYKAGLEYMENNYYNDAIEQFSKAIELYPKYAEVYEARGKAFENIGEYIKAAEDYQRSAVFNNNSAENYRNAARLYFKLNNYTSAIEYIDKSILIKPKYSEAYQLKAEILLSQNELHKAYDAADKALSFNDDAHNYYLHGVISEKLELSSVAEKNYEKAISKDKSFEKVYISLAEIQLKNGNTEEAFKTCSEVIKINKSNDEAYAIRSKIYFKKLEIRLHRTIFSLKGLSHIKTTHLAAE